MIARLRTNLAKIQGITLYMQAAQDITIGGRVSKTQYQYTLDDADPGELNHWAALFLDKIRAIPGIVDVTTDQLNAGPMLDITIKRDVAVELWHPALHHRQHARRRVRPAHRLDDVSPTLNQYHVVLEVEPQFQYGPEALNGIYVTSSSGQQVPLATLVDSVVKVSPLVVNHQGQFPSVTISFNLKPGTAIGQAVAPSSRLKKSSASRSRCRRAFRATPRPSERRCRARRS